MESAFWHERWKQGEIGFHQGEINPYLQRHWHSLELPPGATAFVPLCGKSRDMLWLHEQGHAVIGVEVVAQAVQAFFTENKLTVEVSQGVAHALWHGDGIKIFCGDFFQLGVDDVAGVAGIYDRASLIALPPALRTSYAQHLCGILPGPCKMLLVTLDYPQSEKQGPPFAVTPAEVEALYGRRFEIEPLCADDILAHEPRFQAQGVTQLMERVYLLKAR
jgi:thiopurine S-methyltransferase